MRRRIAVLALASISLAATAGAALAQSFVQDGAGMFSAGTVAQIEQRLTAFNTDTGKQVVVVTVPSLNGSTLEDAAHQTFAQQNVNGVLIFIAKDDRRDVIVPDRAGVQAGWFGPDTLAPIRQSMEAQFKAEDFDAGITSAVDGVLGIYRSHAQSLPSHAAANALPAQSAQIATQPPARGRSHGLFFWILIAVVGFLVLRMVIRAVSGPRPGMPMQTGGVPLQPGGMPMQQGGMPMQGGWGSGYGGGGFWSGMLGGLGGAFLGNELFGNRGNRGGDGGPYVDTSGGGVPGTTPDAGGWGSDAGQSDLGGASSGGWGGGGFGDSGGGFGGGDGGGGGDSGGGW
jgi:uncharacterized protein